MKRKVFIVSAIIVIIISGYFLTVYAYPKNSGRYPAFMLLLLIDYYVWGLIKKKVFTYKKWAKALTGLLYWFPFILLIISVVAAAFVPSTNWNPLLRNIVFGTIFSFFVAKAIMAIVLLVADLLRFTKRMWHSLQEDKKSKLEGEKISRAKFLENLALISGGLIIGSMFTGMFKWVQDFNIKQLSLKLTNLPQAFAGYRIVQISDFHLGSWSTEKPVTEVINRINELEPDLVVFTGDLVNFRTDEAYRFKDSLANLKAKDGIYTILGNHDYGDYINWASKSEKKKNLEELFAFYHQINWNLLRNENAIIRRGTDELALIGVENWSSNKRFPQLGNIIKASKGISKDTLKVLLSHDPSHWDAEITQKHQDIQLMLAGHTHGFQFGVEIPGIRWSPAQYLYKQWAGLYQHETNEQYLYVNRGLGSIGYPGRIGILPEITVIELQNV